MGVRRRVGTRAFFSAIAIILLLSPVPVFSQLPTAMPALSAGPPGITEMTAA